MVREFVTERNRLGMVLFLFSELFFFGVLIASFIYFQAWQTVGPNSTNSLNPGLTGLFSISLFASSGTIWLASRSLRSGSRNGLFFWLVVTVILGAIFLGGQVNEYIKLLNDNVTLNANLFGTTFFTLTGFHGFHVFVGLVSISILAGLARAGQFRPPESTAVEVVSLYWHFVDAVWVVLFGLIYIWPLVSRGG